MIEKIFDKLFGAVKRYKEDALIRRFGGIQQCPWCRQIAQSEKGWHFKACTEVPGYEILTCGVCCGTSRWLWGMGMHFTCAVKPPVPMSGGLVFQKVDENRDKVDLNRCECG